MVPFVFVSCAVDASAYGVAPALVAATPHGSRADVIGSDSAPPVVTYSVRGGPTFGGVYFPLYGGDRPYGEGIRLDLAMQGGAARFRLHALFSASWSPLLRTDAGTAVPAPGEVALFAAMGFRVDTHPNESSAFLLEFDGMFGGSFMAEANETLDGPLPADRFFTLYPLGLRLGLGTRLAGKWEILVSGDLTGGTVWKEQKFDYTAIRATSAILVGRSF